VATVAAHLDALADDPPALSELYRRLSLRALDLAVEKGGIADEKASALAALLDGRPCGVVVE
jgi:hypothetical protein